VATLHKLEEIDSLLVDTGDSELDRELSGRREVVTGYRIAQLKDVKAASENAQKSALGLIASREDR
jgi:hypothetical protein